MKKTQLIMDRYQLGEAIGKGGFATVYRALDTERGDFVAIKQIEKRLLAAEQLPKIMHEADLLKKLTHPNVVVREPFRFSWMRLFSFHSSPRSLGLSRICGDLETHSFCA